MQTIFSLLILVFVTFATNGYKIDYSNGHNKIHFENNRLLNGKPVNEPKLDEAIKTLSKLGFKPDNPQVIQEAQQLDQQEFLQQVAMQKAMRHRALTQLAINQLNKKNEGDSNSITTLAGAESRQLNFAKPGKQNNEYLDVVATKKRKNESASSSNSETSESVSDNSEVDDVQLSPMNNEVYKKILALRNNQPYHKTKITAEDETNTETLTEESETSSDDTLNPLSYQSSRKGQAKMKNSMAQINQNLMAATSYGEELNKLSMYNQQPMFPIHMRNAESQPNHNLVVPTLKGNSYGIYNNQPLMVPPPPPTPSQPKAVLAPMPRPTQGQPQPYATSKIKDTESSDIFITNINENYNNLNNTETENVIAKSNAGTHNLSAKDDATVLKSTSSV